MTNILAEAVNFGGQRKMPPNLVEPLPDLVEPLPDLVDFH